MLQVSELGVPQSTVMDLLCSVITLRSSCCWCWSACALRIHCLIGKFRLGDGGWLVWDHGSMEWFMGRSCGV